MRVSLFGLFLRCTSLMEPWPKLVRSALLVIGFIRFYWFYRFYVSLRDIWCCPILTSRLFTCSYLIIPCVLSTGCHLLYPSCSCMYVLTNTIFYALNLSIHMCLSLHAIWLPPHHSLGEFWLLWILMSRSWSLELGDFLGCRPEKRSGSLDLQQTIWSSILPGPLCAFWVFPL